MIGKVGRQKVIDAHVPKWLARFELIVQRIEVFGTKKSRRNNFHSGRNEVQIYYVPRVSDNRFLQALFLNGRKLNSTKEWRYTIFVAMFLAKLSLINFRSHPDARLHFKEKVAVFTGHNGSGKTNLLDAIHYLSFCKGFLNPSDVQNIHLKEGFFLVEGKFESEDAPLALSCGLKRGQAKIFTRNGKEYERLSEHIGYIPLVVIAPTDIVLLSGGSEERRKFMDAVISQYDRGYLDALIRYNRVLKQRNVLLRQRNPERTMLEVFDMQLAEFAAPIFKARTKFIAIAEPLLLQYYTEMSGGNERVNMRYESQLQNGQLEDLLRQSLERDLALQYTTEGIHKDDIDLEINGFSLKRFASQGQQKTMLIALKLAQFDVLHQAKNLMPLLLLDDIFEKLDQQRITALLNLIAQGHFGQIFITDSHPQRVSEILGSINCAFDHFELPFEASLREAEIHETHDQKEEQPE